MRSILLSTAGLATLALCAAVAASEENLVRNAGFEESEGAGGRPAGGWWLYQGRGESEATVDASVARSGRSSARLHGSEDAKSTLVGPKLPVAPGDDIRFETWVRGAGLPAGANGTYAGIAFRHRDGRVFERAYFATGPLGAEWSRVQGFAHTPEGAVEAEVHVGYTNGPGTIWVDDVLAGITNAFSLALAETPKPWTGEQTVSVLVTSRTAGEFRGAISASIGRKTTNVPVVLAARTARKVPVPIALAGVGAHNYRISVLDAGGTPLRALQGKFQTRPPLVLFPACPCYLLVNGDGKTRVDAQINVNPVARAGLRLELELANADGKRVRQASADASAGDLVGADLRAPVGASGRFTIRARLVDASGKEQGRGETDVRVTEPQLARVEVGERGFVQVKGKPHFVIGMYSCGKYEQMGRAGFSGTHNYGITTGEPDDPINPNDIRLKELLDQSLENGMGMMVELPRKAIEKAKWEQVRRRILTFRHHPGLLCWGSEERVARGEAPLEHIAELYRIVRELDPNHPLVLGDTRDVIQKFQKDRSDFFPDACMDIGIWWWYPIPLKAPDASGVEDPARPPGVLVPPPWLTTTRSTKPLWIAIQSYQQPRQDARFPTPEEYRCLAYLSIINGVKGLWFYTGSGQRDWQGKPAGLLNKPEEGHWDYVQQLVAELRQFSPVILAPRGAARLQVSPADARIEFATRELNGKLHLIAANKSDQVQRVRFNGDALRGKQATVLYEAHEATIAGDVLTDSFEPYAVHIYRLD